MMENIQEKRKNLITQMARIRELMQLLSKKLNKKKRTADLCEL